MKAQIISTDARSITLSLAFGQHVADLGALRLAFEMYLEASKEQTRLSMIQEPTRQDRLHYERTAETVRSHLCGIGTILLPVARAIAEAAGEEGSETPAEEVTEAVETDPTGFEPGKGSAYDYIPSWMTIPSLYSGESQDDPLAVVKLFTPDSGWTWFITEYDGEDICFGLVVGHATELGYFSLAEIAGVKGPHGLRIERDLWFRPTPVTQVEGYLREWGENGPYKGTRDEAQEAGSEEPQPSVQSDAQALDEEAGEPDESAGQGEQSEVVCVLPADEPAAETEPKVEPGKRNGKLPDGIPEAIEVDGGRSKGWLPAAALKVSGRWLHYQFTDGNRKDKVQLTGRGIVWRSAAIAETRTETRSGT